MNNNHSVLPKLRCCAYDILITRVITDPGPSKLIALAEKTDEASFQYKMILIDARELKNCNIKMGSWGSQH